MAYQSMGIRDGTDVDDLVTWASFLFKFKRIAFLLKKSWASRVVCIHMCIYIYIYVHEFIYYIIYIHITYYKYVPGLCNVIHVLGPTYKG